MTSIAVIGALLLVVAIVWQARRRHMQSLPDSSDGQFGEYFHSRFGIDPSEALAERAKISRLIGVPQEKLTPETRFRELLSGPLDSTQIGLTDLEFDLSALADKAGATDQIEMPETVSGVIQLRIKLKSGRSD